MRARLLILCGFVLGVGLLAACSKRASQAPSAAPESGAPSAPAPNPAFRASLVQGADQRVIRTYLESVHEVKPRKFEVEWSKDTVPVSREEAMRSLRAVSADGSEFTFASSEPVVQSLQPGKIVWIWDIAIRRIERVGVIDDATIVHTSTVALNEAMPHADIEFGTPIDFGTAYGVYRPHRLLSPPPRVITRAAPQRPLRMVRYDQEPEPGTQNPPSNPNEPSLQETEDSDLVAATQDGYTGKIAGFEYSLGYRVTQSKLSLEMQARKAEEEEPPKGGAEESHEILRDQKYEFFAYVKEQRSAEHEAQESHERIEKLETELAQIDSQESGKAASNPKLSSLDQKSLNTLRTEDEQAKLMAISDYRHEVAKAELAQQKAKHLADVYGKLFNLFLIASDNVDIRFRARADLNRGLLDAAIKLSPGSNAGTSVNFNDLVGTLDLEFVGRLGATGNAGVSIPVAHVPIMFNIPVPVEGLPLVVQVGADFLAKVALAGKHAAHHFHARFNFSASSGVSATGTSQTDSNFNLSGAESEPEVDEPTASSPGVSGTVLAVQIPRMGLGMGVWGVAAVGYVDQVVVLTMTNAAGVATLNPPCTRMTVDRVSHVGADVTTLLPIPIVTQLLQALSWSKEVWRAKQWIRIKPDIAMCKI